MLFFWPMCPTLKQKRPHGVRLVVTPRTDRKHGNNPLLISIVVNTFSVDGLTLFYVPGHLQVNERTDQEDCEAILKFVAGGSGYIQPLSKVMDVFILNSRLLINFLSHSRHHFVKYMIMGALQLWIVVPGIFTRNMHPSVHHLNLSV